MSKVEVLVSTMYQKDLLKYKEMNIQTDVIFANQDDRYEYYNDKIYGKNVKMVTTGLRGLSQNRIISLLHSNGDICLLADDDMRYIDGYEENVIKAFNQLPNADIIIFNTFNRTTSKVTEKYITEIRRLKFYRSYGSIRIAFRRNSILRNNISFHNQLCSGRMYKSGEDSLFLREAMKKGLKVYLYPYLIAEYSSDNSTWFTGYNSEYFFNKGAWLSAAFPFLKYIVAIYFAIKFKKSTDFSYGEILRLMLNGMKGFEKSISYEEWNNNKTFK